MKDPFPLGPGFLSELVRPLANVCNLTTLPEHIHEVILSTLLYHAIFVYASPWLSTRLFPHIYPKLPFRTRLNWNVHSVSLVQSIVIVTLALYVVLYDAEWKNMDYKERVWGYTGAIGLVQALATGYFTWDLYMCTRYVNIFGVGMLAHGLSALCVYSFGYRPFVNYHGPVFILYEISSPFLNFHWYFDKLGMTGSSAQLYNGILLISSFFLARLVWGMYSSFWVFSDIYHGYQYQKTAAGVQWLASAGLQTSAGLADAVGMEAKGEVLRHAANKDFPLWLAAVYVAANVTLNFLNVYWFGKMVETIRKRFDKPWGTKEPGARADERGIGPKNGSLPRMDDTKSVEAESLDVRQRKTRRKA